MHFHFLIDTGEEGVSAGAVGEMSAAAERKTHSKLIGGLCSIKAVTQMYLFKSEPSFQLTYRPKN